MSGNKRSFTKELIWIYVVGLIGMVIPYTRQFFMVITPINLLVVTGLLFYNHRRWDVKTIMAMVLVAVISFFIEAWGVNSGAIFGEYSYGSTLGPSLFGTPYIIGLNWVLLVYLCYSIGSGLIDRVTGSSSSPHSALKGGKMLLVALTGALFMVAYDIVLEPAAIRLDMWEWAAVSVPLQNYVAWFLLSFAFILFFAISGVNPKNRTALPLFLTQLIFFGALNLWFFIEPRLL